MRHAYTFSLVPDARTRIPRRYNLSRRRAVSSSLPLSASRFIGVAVSYLPLRGYDRSIDRSFRSDDLAARPTRQKCENASDTCARSLMLGRWRRTMPLGQSQVAEEAPTRVACPRIGKRARARARPAGIIQGRVSPPSERQTLPHTCRTRALEAGSKVLSLGKATRGANLEDSSCVQLVSSRNIVASKLNAYRTHRILRLFYPPFFDVIFNRWNSFPR